MKERLSALVGWGRRVSADYTRNRASLAAGGLAYFVALSLAPAAVAFGALAGLFLDTADVRAVLERLAEKAPGTVGDVEPIVDALMATIEGASGSAFTVTTIVSVLLAIYASSKVVLGVRMGMNAAFGLAETRSGLVERAISTVITLVGLIAAVAVVILLTIVPQVLAWFGVGDVRTSTGSWLLDWMIILALVFVSVRWILHHAPNGGLPVPWTSLGAAIAAGWIVAVTAGVGAYARFSGSLGAAVLVFGTAVVILLWLYLCFLGLLWGAVIEADRQRRQVESGASGGEPAGRAGD